MRLREAKGSLGITQESGALLAFRSVCKPPKPIRYLLAPGTAELPDSKVHSSSPAGL